MAVDRGEGADIASADPVRRNSGTDDRAADQAQLRALSGAARDFIDCLMSVIEQGHNSEDPAIRRSFMAVTRPITDAFPIHPPTSAGRAAQASTMQTVGWHANPGILFFPRTGVGRASNIPASHRSWRVAWAEAPHFQQHHCSFNVPISGRPSTMASDKWTHSKVPGHVQDFIDLRRDLHQHPELSFAEHRTSDIVAKRLARMGYTVELGIGGTGVVGQLRRGNGSRHIGIRADMDALPIEEKRLFMGQPVQGVMHACGHDATRRCSWRRHRRLPAIPPGAEP